jgi:ABC-type enterochelin transport system ATPase subunit
METYKIEITIDNLDFASYTGLMSTLKHMIENSKHEIKVCDGKNADASDDRVVCFKCGKITEHDGEGNWCFECKKYTPF